MIENHREHHVKSFLYFSFQQPQIVLLKEGTDTSQGKPQVISNINACQTIVDAVRLHKMKPDPTLVTHNFLSLF